MLLRGHMQNAYVTHHLERAMELVVNRFGVERFDRFDPEMVVKTQLGKRPLAARVASFWVSKLNIEIIESVSSDVDHTVTMPPTIVAMPHRASITSHCGGTMRLRCARRSPDLGCRWPSRTDCDQKRNTASGVRVPRRASRARPLRRVHLEEPRSVEVRGLARREVSRPHFTAGMISSATH